MSDDVPDRRPDHLHCARALVDGRIRSDVLVALGDGVVTALATGRRPDDVPPGTVRVTGVALPGLVNAHSHAFHRLLRGRTQRVDDRSSRVADVGATFWGWREQMYAVAARLDPAALEEVATATFGEMAMAGITCVGEFHYLHHRPDGAPYADPNAMGAALERAAARAGIRLTLLDTLYLTGEVGAGLDDPRLDPVQRRFSDGTAAAWVDRTAPLRDTPTCRHGAAIHSVRAVPPAAMAVVAATARERGWVVHAHVAEHQGERDQSTTRFGHSPVQVLGRAGAIDESFTAVHAVWLDDDDVATLAAAGATVCACPTTERDLADGVVDGAALAAAGVQLALGSDQHAMVDLFEEARALDLDQRLVTGRRGLHAPEALLTMATTGGARSLGWPELGAIRVGAPADLAVVGTGSVRLAGTAPDDLAAALVYAATAADVTHTMVAGRWIVADGRHLDLDVPAALADVATGATA